MYLIVILNFKAIIRIVHKDLQLFRLFVFFVIIELTMIDTN